MLYYLFGLIFSDYCLLQKNKNVQKAHILYESDEPTLDVTLYLLK